MISLEYIAGFFDGEGSIGVYRNGRGTPHLRTQVTQNVTPTSSLVMGELRTRFGGNLSRLDSRPGRPRPVFNWQLNGHGAMKFLSTISEHLVLKKEQAAVAIEWQARKPFSPSRDESGRIKKYVVTTEDIAVEETLKKMKE